MSELQEPLMSKLLDTEERGATPQEQSVEDAFRQVLKDLEVFPVTSHDLDSSVTCTCTCNQGVIVGLEDGAIMLVGSDAEFTPLGKHQDTIRALFASRNIVASGSKDKVVKVWNTEQRKLIASLEGHTEVVSCVAVTLDGKFVVSGSYDKTVKVWNVEQKKLVVSFEGHGGPVICLAITADGGSVVSGSFDRTVRIWNIEQKRQIVSLEGHGDTVRCVILSPDGKMIISGSYDNTVKVWNFEETELLATLEGHGDSVTCVAITADGKRIVSGANDKTVRIWDFENAKGSVALEGHGGPVRCVSLTADGKQIVSGSEDNTLRVWSLEEKKQIASLEGHTDTVRCLSLSPDGTQIVSGSYDNSLKVWNLTDKKQAETLEGHTNYVSCVSASADGKWIISGSYDKTVRIWHSAEKRQVACFEGHNGPVRCVTVTPDNRYIVTGSRDKTLKVWSVKEKKQIATMEGHSDIVTCVSITPDGRHVVSGSDDDTVRVWSFQERRQIASLEGHSFYVTCVEVTPDGRHIVSGSRDRTLRIWSLAEMKQVACLEGHSDSVTCLAILPDGKHIVSGSDDNMVRVWDFEEQKQISWLSGHTGTVTSVSVTPDGKYIVSGSYDKTLKVWSFAEMKEIASLEVHSGPIRCVTLSHDGKCAISGSSDKMVVVTDLTLVIYSRRNEFFNTFADEGISPTKTYYFCGRYQEHLRQGIPIARSVATSPILPHYINSLHLCAYYNQANALNDYLTQGVPIIRGAFGSPLTIALMKNNTKCVEVILRYLTSEFDKNSGFLALQEIVEDFSKLLTCNVPYLVPFFSKLLGPSSQPLPEIIVPYRKLPSIVFQPSRWIHLSDFAQFAGEHMNGVMVQFLVSRFHWNFSSGSAQSLEFLRGLEECADRHILTTPVVARLVQSKWDSLKVIAKAHTLLYICSLLCLIGLIGSPWSPGILSLMFLWLNVFFLLYEVMQSIAAGKNYWLDLWNYVNLIRGAASVLWGWLIFSDVHFQYLEILVVSLCFLRGFTFFRTFRMTRVFVHMVIEVVKEVYAFLVVLAYSTCSFGMMYVVLTPEKITQASGGWTTAYNLLFEEYDNTEFGVLQWLCFTAATLLNVIIMLNLLISILGDAYEKAQISASEHDNLEILKLVIEYESMFFWKRKMKDQSVLIVCKFAGEEDAEDEWKGRLSQIKKAVKDNEVHLGKKLETIEKKLEESQPTFEKKLEEKLSESQLVIETRLENKLEESRIAMEEKLEENRVLMEKKLEESRKAIEAKIDQILTALQAEYQ